MSLIQRITQRNRAADSAPLNSAKFRGQRGASAIEYVIIAAVIAFAIFIAAQTTNLGDAFESFFNNVSDVVEDADPGLGGGGGGGD